MNVDADELENAVLEVIEDEVGGWSGVCVDPKSHNQHASTYRPTAVVALVVIKPEGK